MSSTQFQLPLSSARTSILIYYAKFSEIKGFHFLTDQNWYIIMKICRAQITTVSNTRLTLYTNLSHGKQENVRCLY